MKEFLPLHIRNCAIIGHATVGKTTLSEAMLFTANEVNRLGRVEDGSTTSDYNADEISRKISISSSMLHCAWKSCKLNILDAPGYPDFIGEVISSLRVAELGIVVMNSVAGVEVGTESVWRIAQGYQDARILFVNRLDKEHADFRRCLESAQSRFGKGVMPIQIPVNAGENFDSFVDLMRMVLVKYEKDGSGKHSTANIPPELQSQAQEAHDKLVELAAESEDSLIE
ncbi:MAG TPA: GTP-binding protein, partial [bacterium]